MLRLLVVVLAGSVLSSTAFAQERHVVDPAAIASTVAQRVLEQDADRAAVREALGRPEVRDVAARAGVSLDRLAAAVETIDGSALERAGEAARDVNRSLVGGQSRLVISTTTIIIILLLVILIVVAVD
jgi:hypothetical protein